MRALAPGSPRSGGMLDSLRTEMEELVERFFGESAVAGLTGVWMPRVDVEEKDDEIVVKADLPGTDPADVEVAVMGTTLVLKGERKENREEKKKNFHRMERFVGRFYREVPLPAGVDADKVTATSAKGVLTVTIPKKPEVRPKKITVKAQA